MRPSTTLTAPTPWTGSLDSVEVAKAAANKAGDELAVLNVLSLGAYLSMWLSYLHRLLEARSQADALDAWLRLGADYRLRWQRDSRVGLAILLETNDRLSVIALRLMRDTADSLRGS